MNVPILETERLILRGFAPGDIDRLAEMLANPLVMRYLPGGKPVPRERVAVALERIPQAWEKYGYGRWAVVLKATGELIGWCGLERLEEIGETEVLYLFDEPYWGQGLATEAARATLRYAFEELQRDRIIALAVPENVASRRVMEKLGMTCEETRHLWDLDLVQYALHCDAWEGNTAGSQ